MYISKAFFNLLVAIASSHVKQRPLGFTNRSNYDEDTNLYTGHDITSNKKAIENIVKAGIATVEMDELGNEGIELVARADFLNSFVDGIKSAGIGEDTGYSSYCSCPIAFIAGHQHYTAHRKYKGMAYRLDQGRVCHGMVCEDTGEAWHQ
ncbi:hypothetical protein [Yersinia ruckeri]|uniref:hypothetical protein n=1 Tax=Yersinia ruckeri TaxID=29486 RepID=UPI0020BE60B4|nr:hypothetical protein [Yersinia ruckeri]MCK8586385.1 hypothetical protein [Yersinia ruckeri]MCW6615627.1 hypothetical protein [Yersinia ruckeri]